MRKNMMKFLSFLSLFILLFTTTCYADIVAEAPIEKSESQGWMPFFIGGAIVLVVVISVIIIRRIVRKNGK